MSRMITLSIQHQSLSPPPPPILFYLIVFIITATISIAQNIPLVEKKIINLTSS